MVIQDRDEEFEALADEYTILYVPESMEERFLVQTLAICEVRSRRCMKRLMYEKTKHAPAPAPSGLFVVPKRPRA